MKHGIVAAVRGVLLVAATVLLAEGLSSLILFLSDLRSPASTLAERRHTRYDPEIGWVNIPLLHLPDMYGPGLSLRTDGDGARVDPGRSSSPPAGVRRIICSGDSFTLGFGVGDDQSWPALLSRREGRWETVNLGQGGYDLGQSYLWFRRAGEGRTYDVHLLALTPPLLERMRSAVFLGYGKPRLNARGGELAVENVPVPRGAFYVPWLNDHRAAFAGLRSVALVGKLYRSASSDGGALLDEDEVKETVAFILRDLSARARRQGGTLAVAFLPLKEAYEMPSPEGWHRFVREETERQGLVFFDLVEEMKRLPRERIAELFIPEGSVAYPHAAGHYSAAGNAWVAEALQDKLSRLGY
jgi:hypothetical protein